MNKLFVNAVLNVKSDTITLLLSKEDGKVLRILYREDCSYDGYTDGRFFDEQSLAVIVQKLKENAEESCGLKIKRLTVGVPGEFTPVVEKQFKYDFDRAVKVNNAHVEEVHKYGDTYTGKGNYIALACTPNFYGTDSLLKINNPVGIVTKSLLADLSYVLAEKYFIDIFDRIALRLGLKVSYCPTILSEGMYVVPEELSEKGVILVDSDFMSTTVAYFKEDGILFSTTFPLGTAHIAAGIMDKCNVSYSDSLELIKKINLNVRTTTDSKYTLSVGSSVKTYSMVDVNEVCFEVVHHIGKSIKKVIESIKQDVGESVPVALTGDGIADIVGVKGIIETVLNRLVTTVAPSHTELNSAKDSSLSSLMIYAELQNNRGIKKAVRSLFRI